MIQDDKIITIGKYKVDVSNLPARRKRIAIRMWNDLFNFDQEKDGSIKRDNRGNPKIKEKPKKKTEYQARKGLVKIGLYLIRRDFNILLRRYSKKGAIKEYFKRYFISLRYLESLTDKELDSFIEWVYEEIVGVKKKTADMIDPILNLLERQTKMMTEEEHTHFSKFLLNSFSEQIDLWKNSYHTRKKA